MAVEKVVSFENEKVKLRLEQIAFKHEFQSQTLTFLEHAHITKTYSAPASVVADYLDYKYSQTKPLGFLLWYVDIYKPVRDSIK